MLAAGLRLAAAWQARAIDTDGTAYVALARTLRDGNLPDSSLLVWPPLYPALVALTSLVVSDLEWAGRIVSVLAGTALLFPAAWLARHWIGGRVPLFVATLLAIQPYLVRYGGSVLTESLYFLIFLVAVATSWRGLETGRVSSLWASGLFIGLAYLTRPEGLGLLVVLGFWVTVDTCPWRIHLRRLGALLLGATLVITPYVISLHAQTGIWLLSGKLLARQPLDLTTGYAPSIFLEGPLGQWMAGSGPFLQAIGQAALHGTVRLVEAFHPALILLASLGIVWRRSPLSRPEKFVLSILSGYLLAFFLINPRRRYLVQLVPLGTLWAGIGLDRLAAWMGMRFFATRGGHRNVAAGIGLILLFIALTQLPSALKPMHEHRLVDRQIGEWLGEHGAEGRLVMGEQRQVAFYARARFLYTPRGGFDRVLAYARDAGVDFWVVERADVAKQVPDFPAKISTGDMRRIYSTINKRGQPIEVYVVNSPRRPPRWMIRSTLESDREAQKENGKGGANEKWKQLFR